MAFTENTKVGEIWANEQARAVLLTLCSASCGFPLSFVYENVYAATAGRRESDMVLDAGDAGGCA